LLNASQREAKTVDNYDILSIEPLCKQQRSADTRDIGKAKVRSFHLLNNNIFGGKNYEHRYFRRSTTRGV
jgi:hypothetical protein